MQLDMFAPPPVAEPPKHRPLPVAHLFDTQEQATQFLYGCDGCRFYRLPEGTTVLDASDFYCWKRRELLGRPLVLTVGRVCKTFQEDKEASMDLAREWPIAIKWREVSRGETDKSASHLHRHPHLVPKIVPQRCELGNGGECTPSEPRLVAELEQ
jgi:hypothetical protein